MKFSKFVVVSLFLVVSTFSLSRAVDVNPSKDVNPGLFSGGSHFSIFNGDPKRIQRANEVVLKDFDASVKIDPNPASIRVLKAGALNPSIKVTFTVHNHGKKTYTLSFATAQRWDFRVINTATNDVVYSYSDDHAFLQVVGTTMADPDDKLVYSNAIDVTQFPLGTYRVEAHMANYVEMHAEATVSLVP